ncbi:MAG: aspartate aminotransferase family protein [Deltaproteobacteria bacterium]|nr:aspartate aminotransferase family protein [Deltaproteobacteria bacterium]
MTGPAHRLLQAIRPARHLHPERLCATVGRIEEVLDRFLGRKRSRALLESSNSHELARRMPVGPAQARDLASAIAASCDPDELARISDMLERSEISTAEAIDLHIRHKIPVSGLESDIVPVRAEGCWLHAIDGRCYLDLDSDYGAANLGASNAELGLALMNQACELISMKEERVHIPRARFLKTILEMMPGALDRFYWQNSNGEAVDKALKIAKAFTGCRGVIALEGGFHGRTHGAVAVTHNPAYREPFGLAQEDWVHFVGSDDVRAVEALLAEGRARTVIMELVQGEEAGIRPLDRGFAAEVRRSCDAHGAVLIFDEVQTGFGRVAEKPGQWFACQAYRTLPDILVIGESFGGGYPVRKRGQTPTLDT